LDCLGSLRYRGGILGHRNRACGAAEGRPKAEAISASIDSLRELWVVAAFEGEDLHHSFATIEKPKGIVNLSDDSESEDWRWRVQTSAGNIAVPEGKQEQRRSNHQIYRYKLSNISLLNDVSWLL